MAKLRIVSALDVGDGKQFHAVFRTLDSYFDFFFYVVSILIGVIIRLNFAIIGDYHNSKIHY